MPRPLRYVIEREREAEFARLKVENWNLKYPVGAAVYLLKDNGESETTKTRSVAYVCDSGHPVVFLDGVSGYYSLDRVTIKDFGDL